MRPQEHRQRDGDEDEPEEAHDDQRAEGAKLVDEELVPWAIIPVSVSMPASQTLMFTSDRITKMLATRKPPTTRAAGMKKAVSLTSV